MRSLMSRDLRWPRRPRVARLVIIVITMWIACAFVPALAVAAGGEAPVIESTGSSVGGEVSVSASINPEGLVTSYELKLVCGVCGPAGYAPATGQLSAVQEAISVSLELPGIKPGTYSFEVRARNSAGELARKRLAGTPNFQNLRQRKRARNTKLKSARRHKRNRKNGTRATRPKRRNSRR